MKKITELTAELAAPAIAEQGCMLRPGSHFEESTILSIEALQNGLCNQ